MEGISESVDELFGEAVLRIFGVFFDRDDDVGMIVVKTVNQIIRLALCRSTNLKITT